MNFLRDNARLFAMLFIAIATAVFGDFDVEAGENFLTNLISESGFFLGTGLVVLTGYIGERRLIGIEPNTTLTSAVAVLTVLLPILSPGVDWSSLLATLSSFSGSGVLTIGAVFGVLINYFADIRIGRPAPEGSERSSYTSQYYTFSDLPKIIAKGRRS